MRKFSSAESGSAPAATELTVEGMNCSHCVKAVSDSLKSIEGVNDVGITLETGKVIVHGSVADKSKLNEAVESAGYKVKRVVLNYICST